MEFICTVCADEQKRHTAKLAGQMGEELERSLVRPMQIFDDDHCRPLARQIV
jgi:hypothetical protein